MSSNTGTYSHSSESALSRLESLPKEILLDTLDLLPWKDLKCVRRTNKFLNGLVTPTIFRTIRLLNDPEQVRAQLSQATQFHLRTVILDWNDRADGEYTLLHVPVTTAAMRDSLQRWDKVREVIITSKMTMHLSREAASPLDESGSAVSCQVPLIAFLQELESLNSLLLYGSDQTITVSAAIGKMRWLRPPTLSTMRALSKVTLYLDNARSAALDLIAPHKGEENDLEVSYVYGNLYSRKFIHASQARGTEGDFADMIAEVWDQISSLGLSIATVLKSGRNHRVRVLNSSNIVKHAPTEELFQEEHHFASDEIVKQVLEGSVQLKYELLTNSYIQPSDANRVQWSEEPEGSYDPRICQRSQIAQNSI